MKYYKKIKPVRLILFMALFLAVSCVFLDGIGYEETLTAGQEATFTMDVRVKPNENASGEKLIISILVPNSWDTENTTTVTYTSSIDQGVQYMSLIPINVLPSSGNGATWPDHLRNKFGVGPNVLTDMKWITFQSDKVYTIAVNEEVTADVTIKTLVGPKNLRTKLGFFVNNSGDGLGNDPQRWKVQYSDCIEVTGGEGALIDFCELHFNVAQPLTATKNDFITYKFQGNIQPNELIDEDEVHFCATAYTNSGGVHQVCDYSAATRMQRESEFSDTYSITIWPADYFDIPENEEIDYIEYSFKNNGGSIEVKENDGSLFKYLFDCN